jgi:hypothetical protein
VLVLGELPAPRLRIRAGVAVVELGRSEPRGTLPRCLPQASNLAQALGRSGKLVVIEPGDLPDLDAALAATPDAPVLAPCSARDAATRDALAHVVFSSNEADLLLALRGDGPETAFALGAAAAAPRELTKRGVALAARRLVSSLRAGERPLAASREAARRPSVKLAPRPARAALAAPARGRCPYCHRDLRDPAGAGDVLSGPPVGCAECGTEHHRDCVSEHGRCTVLGCGGTRLLRLGVTVPVERLGGADPRAHPFSALAGEPGLEPSSLRVEAPIDDPDARPTRRRIALELPEPSARRGGMVDGYLTVWAPKPFRIRGAVLRVRASLTTRPRRDGKPPQTTPILAREASLVGDAPAGALGRLQDGVVSLFSKQSTGVAIPAGVRRYPFSLRLDPVHPATVTNLLPDVEEQVTTTLEACLDTDLTTLELKVQP